MKPAVRIGLYVVLVILAGYFFGRFRSAYQTPPNPSSAESELAMPNDVTAETHAVTGSVDPQVSTNDIPAPATRLEITNAPAATVVTATNTPAAAAATMAATPPPRRSDSLRFLGLFILFFLALGGLGAWDLSHYFGGRAGRAVMAEDWIERRDPEYEKAEEEWSKGNHLDAISLMREYLAKNPLEQHVAIRIAEIYEKDLGNYLAAALELQDVLTRRLPRERWGWTAVRLANLYSGRLNQSDKAIALLERIVNEYGDTAAAKKARSRLGIPEPAEPTPETTPEAAAAESPESLPPPPEPEEPPGASNLPKGFRPRK